jgi:hypothetical protein
LKTAHEFFLAIAETAAWPEQLEAQRAESIDWLERMSEEIFSRLDISGASGRLRDNIIAWEFMLKGVQLRLKRDAIREQEQIRRTLEAPGILFGKAN